MHEEIRKFWSQSFLFTLACIGKSHLFVEMLGEVARRDEHLQNMKSSINVLIFIKQFSNNAEYVPT